MSTAIEIPPAEIRERGRIESCDEREIVFSLPAEMGAYEDGIDIKIDSSTLARISVRPFQRGQYVRKSEERLEFAFHFPPALFAGKSRGRISLVNVRDGHELGGGGIFPKRTGRKPRILVFIPAGARWKHNSVELYKQPWDTLVGKYFNVGDMMVYDSTLKMLDYENLDVARITEITKEDIDRYNESFDYCFLRGSNYIHEQMQWLNARPLLEKLHLPFYALGVGAQVASARKLNLSPDSVAIWKMISERCGSIGVRGSFTADTLESLGIHNVDIIGCPSLFRKCDRNMTLRTKDLREIGHIAFSLRREVNKVYSDNPQQYLKVQREAMLRLDAECRRMTLTVHGEPEEKAFFFRDVGAMATATESLRRGGWLTPDTEDRILSIYRNQSYMYTRADDYDEFIRTVDFAIGYRVHGVLPALANGTPGALVNYDVRSDELARTHSIPLLSEADMSEKSWRDIYASLDFGTFNREYSAGYDRMKRFLARNGIPNLL